MTKPSQDLPVPPPAKSPAKATYTKPVLHIYGAVSKLTLGSAQGGGDAGNKTMLSSDRATKQNVSRLATHSSGVGIYLFTYKPELRARCGHGWQIGVMADEVEARLPQAVSRDAYGFQQVNYALLHQLPHA